MSTIQASINEVYLNLKKIQQEFSLGNFKNLDYYLVYAKNEYNYILEFATAFGNLEIVKKLIESGANINYRKSIAFKIACLKGHLDVVKYFLELNKLDKNNLSNVLVDTLDNDHIEIVLYLLSDKYIDLFDIGYLYDYALRISLDKNLFDIASILLKHGANINVLNGYILLNAIKHNNIPVVDFAIKAGVNRKFFREGISIARKNSNHQVLGMLIQILLDG